MIRNYNGPTIRYVIWLLKDQCKKLAEAREGLFTKLKSKGIFKVATNLGPFGEADCCSNVVTLTNAEDIQIFLEALMKEKIDAILYFYPSATNDPFTKMLIDLILANGGYFPNKEKLKQMYGEAEALRLSLLSKNAEKVSSLTPFDMLLKECLELAEEVMELTRQKNPDLITVRTEDYPDYMEFFDEENNIYANIFWDRWADPHHNTDHSISVKFMNEWNREIFLDHEYHDPDSFEFVVTHHSDDPFVDDNEYAVRLFIALHKALCKAATDLGFEFLSEVETYDNITL